MFTYEYVDFSTTFRGIRTCLASGDFQQLASLLRGLDVMSRDVVLAPARNDTVPIQEVSVQTARH